MIGLALMVGVLGGSIWWASGGGDKPRSLTAPAHSTPGSAPAAGSSPVASPDSQSSSSAGQAGQGSSGLPPGLPANSPPSTSSGAGGQQPIPGQQGTTGPTKNAASPTSHPKIPAPPPSRSNPYTAEQVCNSGGHGSGYYRQRSSSFSGGTVEQLYNSSGYNCVVTMKTVNVGKKTDVWATLVSKNGKSSADQGSYSYYAGPVFVYARGQCVKYSGGAGNSSAAAPWGNCG